MLKTLLNASSAWVIPLRPLTISLMRWYGTWILSANSTLIRPIGLRNSSSNISPGWVGVRFVGTRTIFFSSLLLSGNRQFQLGRDLNQSKQNKYGMIINTNTVWPFLSPDKLNLLPGGIRNSESEVTESIRSSLRLQFSILKWDRFFRASLYSHHWRYPRSRILKHWIMQYDSTILVLFQGCKFIQNA